MKTKPNSERTYGLIVLYEMHTDFLKRALQGITEEDAQKRLDTKANHIAWITGSIVDGRYYLAKSLGLDIDSSTLTLFKDNHSIIDDAKYPSLKDFLKDWDNVAAELQTALINANDEKLNEDIEMPGMKMTLYDMVSFTIYREANCIGQIALWRRLLGYPGMNYM